VALEDLQALDGSVFGDDGFHDYLSLHVCEAGQLGIGGWGRGDQVGGHDSRGDVDSVGGR